MPARPPKELIQLLERYDRRVQEIALALREVVIEEMAPCCESIYEVYIISLVYSAPEKDAVCYIGVNRNHVNLGFHQGARLSDPEGLLEGAGKQMRHIKIHSANDLMNPAIRAYLQEACERAGYEIVPGRKKIVSTTIKLKNQAKRSVEKAAAGRAGRR